MFVVFIGNGVRKYIFCFFSDRQLIGGLLGTLLVEWTLDGDFIRFALFATVPLLYCVSLVCTNVLKVLPNSRSTTPVLCPPNRPELNHVVRTHSLILPLTKLTLYSKHRPNRPLSRELEILLCDQASTRQRAG
jgi:hypothetical protein